MTVDVTCGQPDIIWNGVHETMNKLEFTPIRNVNTVIVFTFGKCVPQTMNKVEFHNPQCQNSGIFMAICSYRSILT